MARSKQVKRRRGSHVPRQVHVSKEKRAYDDRVNNLKKAATDASNRAEIYLLAIDAANNFPSWELWFATGLFKLMHTKNAWLLRDFSSGIVRKEVQDYL
jgi:hypothetical protein